MIKIADEKGGHQFADQSSRRNAGAPPVHILGNSVEYGAQDNKYNDDAAGFKPETPVFLGKERLESDEQKNKREEEGS